MLEEDGARRALRQLRCLKGLSVIGALVLSGCNTIEGGPPRLFSVSEEADAARIRLVSLEENYYKFPNKTLRNDIVAGRMREIDSFYFAFESSLIRERQEAGFVSSVVGIALSGAVPLFSAVATKNVLGAVSSGVQGVDKAYSDEVLFQKTVQVLATQMQARRALVASDIIKRMKALDIDEYPLPMALGDLDDYYAAGTIAGALIEIQKTVSAESAVAETAKVNSIEVTFGSSDTTAALQACLRKPGALSALRGLMKPASGALLGSLTIDGSEQAEAQRMALLSRAKNAGVC